MSNSPKFKFYKVGGYVRDSLINCDIVGQDVDYCVTVDDTDNVNTKYTLDEIYNFLCNHLENNKCIIYTKTPECYTIRAKCPKQFIHRTNLSCPNNLYEVGDFVLARKELGYDADSRKPRLSPTIGSLYDDLLRRDFTINAIAIDPETGSYIDFCDGLKDIDDKILRTPTDTYTSLLDDPLRIMRGLRFSIVLGFTLNDQFWEVLKNKEIWDKFSRVVSIDRVRNEINKMFSFDTLKTLEILFKIKNINQDAFRLILKNILLKPVQVYC